MRWSKLLLWTLICLLICGGSALAEEPLADRYAAEFQGCYGGTLPEDTEVRVQTDLRQEGNFELVDVTICAAAWLGKGYDVNRPERDTAFGLIVRARAQDEDRYELRDGNMEQRWPPAPGETRTHASQDEWDPNRIPLMFDQVGRASLRTAGGEKLEFDLSMTAAYMDEKTGEAVCQYGFAVSDAMMARLRKQADAEGRIRLAYRCFIEQREGEPIESEFTFSVALPDPGDPALRAPFEVGAQRLFELSDARALYIPARLQTILSEQEEHPLVYSWVDTAAWLGKDVDPERPDQEVLLLRFSALSANGACELHAFGNVEDFAVLRDRRQQQGAQEPALLMMFECDAADSLSIDGAGGTAFSPIRSNIVDEEIGEVRGMVAYAFNDAQMRRLRGHADRYGYVRLAYTPALHVEGGMPMSIQITFTVKLPD